MCGTPRYFWPAAVISALTALFTLAVLAAPQQVRRHQVAPTRGRLYQQPRPTQRQYSDWHRAQRPIQHPRDRAGLPRLERPPIRVEPRSS